MEKPAVGDSFWANLTFDGLRNFLADLRAECLAKGHPMPKAILLSESDRRDLNQRIMAESVVLVSSPDQRPEHDGDAVGIIEGVVFLSHPDVPRGKARFIIDPPDPLD